MLLNPPGSLLISHTHARARASWRESADLVAKRWDVFLQTDGSNRRWAFAAYVAALDAEEAAASLMAAVSGETA